MSKKQLENRIKDLIPLYGIYNFFKDWNTPNMRENVEIISKGSRRSAIILGLIPLQIMECGGLYKLIDYMSKNPTEIIESTKEAIGLLGKYVFM